ncbi:MAG: CARDB domain-containing protein, partial [Candidatus Thermoplasmatota archaeon]|nr:CARDB domain-containing protein [Candidatus Thermoplasmatota archaeon]
LVINDTAVRFLTDDSPAYILIENGGKLEMNNVTLSSTGGNPLYVYLMGSSGPELTLNEGSIKVNSLVARDTAIMDLKGEHMNGSINLHGSNVDVSIMSDTITSPSVYARDCTLKMGGGMVAIEDLDWSGVSFSSEDAVFSTVLDVDRSASLTNVTYSGNLPDERTNWLKALGSGVIQRSWWVNAQVQDSVQNPVVGATIYVQRIVGPLHIDISTHITAENGTVMFPVVQEEIRSTGRTYLGNYRLNASYMGINSPPLSAVVSGTDVDAIVILPGGPNIVPDMVWVEGTMIDGFPVIINGSFINDGEFATDPFTASILVNGESIGEGDLPGLAPGASSMISATWTCIEGDVIISLSADINDEVTETDEDDNVLDDPNTIGIGPDYMVDLDIPPVEWAYNTSGQFKIVVSNEGEQDPEENSFYVNITWDDQDGGGIIETFIMFDYIPPGEIVKRTINWTPSAVGSVNLIASIVSKYDRSPINSIDMMNINVLSLPDIHLVMSSFSVDSPDPVTVNTTVMVLFSIENTGDLPASPFIVSLYDGEISEEAKVDLDASVPGLAPGEELEMEFIWFAGLPIGLHDLIVSIDALNSVKEQDEMNNVVIFPVRIDTPPDLTFTTNIGVSPQIVTEGKNATFWATVKNNGNTMARNAKVQFALDSDTNVIEMIEIDLLPGQERNISIIWTAVRTAEETGFRTMFIVADPVDSILEPNEENNLRSIDIKVISRPDLYMGPNDLYVSEQYDIDIGDEVAISATIRNSGETPAKDIFIRFYDGDPLEGGKIISWKETQPSISIRSLPAGGFRWANITWTPTSGGYHDIYVVLDLIDAIKESNEENNKVFWQVYVQTLPDMELTNISLYQGEFNVNSAGVGSILTINTTVENTGDVVSPV